MQELAEKLKINIAISPWMFKYKDLGWGYQPTTQEQWDFFEKYCGEYSDDQYFDWIVSMNEQRGKDKWL